ncbi:MAG: CPBP family intramembrane metalloprotease [Flavobacteriaceae bacterium]|nr:CPBP family intramembrane metalloprotease [Flavobacteriaceae bacterium]
MKDYIALATKSHHEWWRYFLGVFFVFVIWQIGTLPLAIAVGTKVAMEDGMDKIMDIADYNVMMNTLDSNLTFFLLLLSFVFGFFGVWLVAKFFHGQRFKDLLTTREHFDWSRVGVGFSIIALFVIATTLIDYWVNPEAYIFNFKSKEFLILAVIGIVMVPLQTSFEEIYFRGYLMQGLGVVFKNRAVPFVVTSVGFGLLHLGNPEVAKLGIILMINYIGTGFLLAIMALMDEGLELSIGYHAGNNLITALLVTADWTAFQTESILISVEEPSVGIEIFFPVLVIYPLFIYFLAKKYNWNNWRNRLVGKVNIPQ